MAITHADLAPGRRSTDLGSQTGAFLMVLSILCGLCSFILCLLAEATRSEVTWILESIAGKPESYVCMYNGSGRTPLLCAAGAFVSLAIGMVMEHAYMLVAVSQATPAALIAWKPDSRFAKSLTWQAAFFFVSTWVCFAVGEVLLMIGLGVESGHLKEWSRPRLSCLVVRQGLFVAAGMFGLTTVCLAAGLYLTALRAQRLCRREDNVRQEVLNIATLNASPPSSSRPTSAFSENLHVQLDHVDRALTNLDMLALDKIGHPTE